MSVSVAKQAILYMILQLPLTRIQYCHGLILALTGVTRKQEWGKASRTASMVFFISSFDILYGVIVCGVCVLSINPNSWWKFIINFSWQIIKDVIMRFFSHIFLYVIWISNTCWNGSNQEYTKLHMNMVTSPLNSKRRKTFFYNWWKMIKWKIGNEINWTLNDYQMCTNKNGVKK